MKRFVLLILSLFFSLAGFSQLTEGFEGTTGPDALPSTNWTLISGNWATFGGSAIGNTVRWTVNPSNYPANIGGTVAAYVNRENIGINNTSEDYLATPKVTIPNNGRLKFFTRLTTSGDQGTTLKLRIAPGTSVQTDPNAYVDFQTWTEDGLIDPNATGYSLTAYYEITVTFPSTYWGNQYYLAFDRLFTQTGNATGGDRWLIDDVRLEEQCFMPTAFAGTATAIAATSATVSWTPAAPAGTSWEYVLQLDTAGLPTGTGTVPTSNTISPTGLIPNTQYNVYVRSVCASGTKSDWTLILPVAGQTYTFKTLRLGSTCSDPIVVGTLPYLTSDTSANYGNNVATTGNTPGTSCGVTAAYLAGNDVVYAYTANFTGNLGVDLAPNNGQTNSGVFAYSSCAAIGTTCLGGFGNTGAGIRSFNFPVTAGSTYYIVVSTLTGTTSVAYNLSLQVFTCTPPNPALNTLTAGTITDNSAILGWANGTGSTPTSWQFVVQPAGTGIPTTSGTTTNTRTGNLADTLNPLTLYEFYVRADCGNGTFSQWVGPKTFFTSGIGSTCGNPINITSLPYTTTGTTATYGNFIATGPSGAGLNCGGAGSSLAGNDVVYAFTPTYTGGVTVTLTPTGTLGGVYMYDSCANIKISCLAGGFNTGTSTTPITYDVSVTNGQTYYIVISSSTAGGTLPYTLNLVKINCAPPTGLTAANITAHSADLSWANPSFSSSWEVYVVTTGTTAPTDTTSGVTANTNTNFSTGQTLLSNTAYEYYVRANCGDGTFSIWKGPFPFTTQPDYCVGDHFYDSGGATGQYANNENRTTTICSNIAGGVVQVVFNSFDTEATFDALYVYDGPNTTSPLIPSTNPAGSVPGSLAGGYWGTTIPGPFISSGASGCLTFVFRSEGFGTRDGWDASVQCFGVQTCPRPSALTLSNITTTSVQLNWTENGTATQWEVFAQAPGSGFPAANAVGLPVLSPPPFVYPGLITNTPYEFYVRAVCSTSDKSIWTGPKTATTLIDYCVVGNFYDSGGAAGNYANSEDITTTICPTIPGGLVSIVFNSFNTEATFDALYVFDGPDINSPLIPSTNPAGTVPGGLAGGYWGTTSPGTLLALNPSGCLTFRFRSEGAVNRSGWDATVVCLPPQTCARPITLSAPVINPTNAIVTWTQPANPNGSVATSWEWIRLPASAPAPLQNAVGTPTFNNPLGLTGLSSGTRYAVYVRAICSTTDSSLWSTVFYFTTPLENDNCDGAILAPVNSNNVCEQTVGGTIFNASDSGIALTAPCVGTADDDVWYYFTATNTSHFVSLSNVTGSTTNLNYVVYSGGDCNNLTQLFCSPANTLTNVVNGLAPGLTYYIRVYSNSSTPETSTFTLCVSTPSTCSNSSGLCLDNQASFPYANTTGVTSLGTIGCLFSTPNPTYLVIRISQDGPVNYTISQASNGSATANLDVDYAAWGPFPDRSTACAAISGGQAPGVVPGVAATTTTGCSFSAASTENLNIVNALAGQIYILLVTNYSNNAGSITINQNNYTSPGHGETQCCPEAKFSYTANIYCKNAANPTPTILPNSASGVFTANPSGLVFIDTATGQIDLINSAPGSYQITNTVAPTVLCVDPATYTRTVTIYEPNSATINYAASTTFCNSDNNPITPVITGSQGGAFSINPGGLNINPLTGEINPIGSQAGTYTVNYYFSANGGCPAFNSNPVQITVNEAPRFTTPTSASVCNSYTLPTLTAGNYFTAANGTGTQLNAGDVITTTQTIYVFSQNAGCTRNDSFTITITTLPVPTLDVVQPTCTTPTGCITVTAPVTPIGGGGLPGNLFISEVTDAATGQLTYVELYNATGAPVNLANYKLKFYTFGAAPGPTANLACNLTLSGTIANNATNLIKVSTAANIAGVTANQTFVGCGGVNNNDYIVLTTSTDVAVDLWGLTNGTVYTPLGQTGYTYRRKANAVVPSATWIQSDWDALDPEVYTGLGAHSIILNNAYLYSINNGAFTNITNYCNLAAGPYTITVKDTNSNCTSSTNVTLDIINSNPVFTNFTLPTSVCKNIANATVTPTLATNFTSGGAFSALPAGLTINSGNGSIDVLASAPGVYTVKYDLAANNTNCTPASSFTQQIEIKATTTPVTTISYTTPICRLGATTITPSGAFVTGGVFTCTNAALNLNPSTGIISNISTTTAGIYTIKYAIAEDLGTCTAASESTFDIEINDPGTLATVGFTYTTPVCTYATASILNPIKVTGFTNGGLYTASPTGLNINSATGTIDVSTSQSGVYIITYAVLDNPTSCIAANSAQFTITINTQATPELIFTYPTPVVQVPGVMTVFPTFNSANYTLGGTFTSNPTSLVINPTTGEIDVAASQIGTYFIRYTVNADNTNNGCMSGGYYEFQFDIVQANNPVTTFSYNPNSICKLVGGTITPDTSAVGFATGGFYTATPAGLDIDATTGVINVNNSTAGNYVVRYEVLPAGGVLGGFTDVNFTITNPTQPDVQFSYTTPICKITNAPVLQPAYASTFATNGLFTTTAGLSLSGTTGYIAVNTSNPGSYTVLYTVPANLIACISAGSSSAPIQINGLIVPNTNYSYSSPVCKSTNAPALTPSTTGFSFGGTFTATPAGLSLNTSNGVINVQGSTAQSYQVIYTLAENTSTCTAGTITSPVTIAINDLQTPVTTFSYITPLCKATPSISLTPTLATGFNNGGTFSSIPGFVINPNTGAFSTSNAAGSYSINYSVAENPATCTAGNLTNPTSFSVTLNTPSSPDLIFSYPTTPVCPDVTAGNLPTLSPTFTSGGLFTAAGLAINPTSGEIVPSNNTAGTYSVNYSISADYSNAVCRDAGSRQIPFTIKTPISFSITGGCDGMTYYLNLSANNSSFVAATSTINWSLAGANMGSGDAIVAPTTGLYDINVTYNGCSKSDTYNVSNVTCTTQRGISPNNDGKNDTFDLKGQNVQNLSIFNRYGLKVYSKSNYTDEWSGQTDGGSELPDGTYFFMIEQYGGASKSGWIYISRQN